MGLHCKNCGNYTIPIVEALAYSTDGSMRCKSCRRLSAVAKPLRTFFSVIEGTSILVGAIYSIALVTAWPLLVSIFVAGVVRVIVAPAFAKVKEGLF